MNLFKFFQDEAIDWSRFLEQHGNPADRQRWQSRIDNTELTRGQIAVLQTFRRQTRILCMAGTWCGDCVAQCPILIRAAASTDLIELRFIDRDASDVVKSELQICGAARVPQVVFFSELGEEVSRFGDRTLPGYRSMGGVADVMSPGESVSDKICQAWIDELERVQWILRLSPKLRQIHGD